MKLAAILAVVKLVFACAHATGTSPSPVAHGRKNTDDNNEDEKESGNNNIISLDERRKRRHLLEANTECVLYLKNLQYEDGRGEDSWSCEFPPSIAKTFGGVGMMDIKGVSKEDLDLGGAVSGESILRLSDSAYVEQSRRGSNENTVLQIPQQASSYRIEMMDWKIDIRHTRNRRSRLRRQRRLDKVSAGSLDTYKVLVVRVVDGAGVCPDAKADQLQEDIFSGEVCLKSQYEACSHDQIVIEQATEFSTKLGNGVTVNGIVDVQVESLASGGNYKKLESEAVAAATSTYGQFSSLAETFDFVMFCQPPGTGDWLAYAYVNDWRTFYNNKWCQRVSAQMHEVGHNLNLAHSGLPNDSVYADKSGMMGFSYVDEGGPVQCFNAAKSYQLGWYSMQTSSINPLDYIGNPQTFVLNGVADYRKSGFNGDALISLRLEHNGNDGGIDYYIGYNRKRGCNKGTAQVPNKVTLLEKENPYARSDGAGPDGYGLSRRIAALSAGQSTILENYAGSRSDVTLTVNYIKMRKASITITTSEPAETLAPTTCIGNNLNIEIGTDSFGSETRWSIEDRETSEIVIQSTEGYFSNTVYELPSPSSSYCVTPGKCYIFTITDQVGDGMCCAYGYGYYRGYLEGIKIFEGGTFKFEDSIDFCVPSGDDDEFIVVTNRPSEPATKSPTEAPSISPSEVPTKGPVFLPTTISPTKEPTLSPTQKPSMKPSPAQAPTLGCNDDPNFRFKNNGKWDCDWVGNGSVGRTRKICERNDQVVASCKKTCGKVEVGPCRLKKKKKKKKQKKPSRRT